MAGLADLGRVLSIIAHITVGLFGMVLLMGASKGFSEAVEDARNASCP